MNTIADLKQELISKKLSVKWKVLCDIGPSWIGSKRDICFYLDSFPMEDNSIHQYLIELLIKTLNIPAKSEDDIIEGDGNLFVLNNELYIDYSINYSIPYDYAHKHENGKVVLISNI